MMHVQMQMHVGVVHLFALPTKAQATERLTLSVGSRLLDKLYPGFHDLLDRDACLIVALFEQRIRKPCCVRNVSA